MSKRYQCPQTMWDLQPCALPEGHGEPHSTHVFFQRGATIDKVLENVVEVLTEQQGTCPESLRQALRERLEEVCRG